AIKGKRFPPSFLGGAGGLMQRRRIDVRHDNPGAMLGKQLRSGLPDSARRTGNDGDFVFKKLHFCPSESHPPRRHGKLQFCTPVATCVLLSAQSSLDENPDPPLVFSVPPCLRGENYFLVAISGRMLSVPDQYFLRNSFLRILPVPVFGRTSMNSIERGHL